jgi:hypothetical protein
MGHHDDVVLLLAERPVGLVNDVVGFEDTPTFEVERIGEVLGPGLKVE